MMCVIIKKSEANKKVHSSMQKSPPPKGVTHGSSNGASGGVVFSFAALPLHAKDEKGLVCACASFPCGKTMAFFGGLGVCTRWCSASLFPKLWLKSLKRIVASFLSDAAAFLGRPYIDFKSSCNADAGFACLCRGGISLLAF